MRIIALAIPLVLTGLAGCSAGPDNYASMTTTGVGFGDYQRYLRQRETSPGNSSGIPYSVPPQSAANPTQAPILPPASMPARVPTTVDAVPVRTIPAPAAQASSPAPSSAQTGSGPIATQTLAPVTPAPQPAAPQPAVQAAPAGTGPAFGATPVAASAPAPSPGAGIRDAQTYHADAATPAGARGAAPAPAQIVAVTSVPAPSESGGANLMEYALSVTHAPGTEVYRRANPMRWSSWQNNCLAFRNQDAAQRAFLEAGGPDRDRENLDPDGDGFACWWDPTPLRRAVASR